MFFLKEQFGSLGLTFRLAKFKIQSENRNNFLGLLWEFLNPAIQISMYWFVFGLGIRGNSDVEGIPFVHWMLTGIIMWFFVNAAIYEGTTSIYQRYNTVAKMNFPLTVIPSHTIMGKLYVHLVMLLFLLIFLNFSGYPISIYYIQLIYFIGLTYFLALAVALVTSTLAVLIRDVTMLVQALLRVLFFVSPILWLPNLLPEDIQKIIMLNPFYYLANGYRASLLSNEWYILIEWKLTIYNISLVGVFFFIGAYLHFKFKDRFSDYI